MDKREEFIAQARKVHGNKYDYSKLVYGKAHDKMCIICPEHGEFWQDKFTHLRGCGCPECGKIKRADNSRFTQEQFITKCKEVWGDNYTYENTFYRDIMSKIIVTCPIHGDFEVRANDFIRGHGCAKCAGTKKLTTEEFVERARNVHGDRYDYSKVEYVNMSSKVCIICPEHGEFWQTPRLHLQGDGCWMCNQSFMKTTEQFIVDARNVHGDKYDYSKVNYCGNKKKIKIICPKHGEWLVRPLDHLHGKGCPGCKESHLEREVGKILQSKNIKFIREKKFDWLNGKSLDYYLPDKHVVIECQGKQHFTNVQTFGGMIDFSQAIKRDVDKYNECVQHDLKIIYVIDDKIKFDLRNEMFCGIYSENNTFRLCRLQKLLETDEWYKNSTPGAVIDMDEKNLQPFIESVDYNVSNKKVIKEDKFSKFDNWLLS